MQWAYTYNIQVNPYVPEDQAELSVYSTTAEILDASNFHIVHGFLKFQCDINLPLF